MDNVTTPFEMLGGKEIIERLVDAFYNHVSTHPDLMPLFPNAFVEIARKQKQFLTQYLGGPPLYSMEHGHPMMRARHMPFQITETRAQAWLSCMRKAMDDIGLQGVMRDEFYHRLVLTAQHMINTAESEVEPRE